MANKSINQPLDDDASLATIVSHGPGLICLLEADGRFRRLSGALCTLFGRSEAELAGQSWMDHITSVEPCNTTDALCFEGCMRGADGARRWLKWSISGLTDGGQLWVLEDITAAKHSVHRVATVLGVMRALAVGRDARSVPKVIEAVCAADGWAAGRLWWHRGDAMTSVGTWPAARDAATCTRDDGCVGAAWATAEVCIDGEGDATLVAVPIVDADRNVLGVLELRSASPREADEATLEILRYVALQIGRVTRRWELIEPDHDRPSRMFTGPTAEADEGLRTALAFAPMVLMSLDDHGRFTSLGGDERTRASLGLTSASSELIGSRIFERDQLASELVQSVRLALDGHEHTMTFGIEAARYYARFAPLQEGGVVGALFDVTEASADRAFASTRTRAIAADRLAALGSLAGSVANEINNAMTSVRLSLGRLVSFELSLQPMTPSRSHRIELLQDAREGITRVERITHELRAFASNETNVNREAIDVRDVVDAVLRVSSHELKHRARVTCEHADVPKIWAAEGQLRQLFLSLVLHAAHAIPEGEAHLHEIRIATSTDATGRAVVEISDDAAGIPVAELDRLFDPDVASSGHWTALGLSVCRDTVIALAGEITVTSEVDRGTVVRVVLPASDHHVRMSTKASAPVKAETVERTRADRGRILIVDDDRPVAAAVALELAAYDVVVAGSGREALEYLRRDQTFDLVLCDLMMPEVSGMDLFEAVRAFSSQVAERFLFMTGGAFTERAATFLREVANTHIEKPFSADELRAIVRERMRQEAVTDEAAVPTGFRNGVPSEIRDNASR